MNTATSFISNNRQKISTNVLYFFICLLYGVLLAYAAFILYEGAEKLVAYFNGCIAAANDQLNYCIRENL